jgi:hypothetical protein
MDSDTPTIALSFEGYWRDKKKAAVPAASGIYCVYTCIYSGRKQTCSPQKLVYIGAAGDVRARLADPAGREAWEAHIDTGEELCFSFAPLAVEQCEHCAAALVRKHKPPENAKPGPDFPYPQTRFTLSGSAGFLSKAFTL